MGLRPVRQPGSKPAGSFHPPDLTSIITFTESLILDENEVASKKRHWGAFDETWHWFGPRVWTQGPKTAPRAFFTDTLLMPIHTGGGGDRCKASTGTHGGWR